MLQLRHFRFLNPEWFRKPQSNLEATLRIPGVMKEAVVLILTRATPLVLFFSLVLNLMLGLPAVAITLGFVMYLLVELWTQEQWYKRKLLPRQKTNIELVNNLKTDGTNSDLIKSIELAVSLFAKGLVRIGYVGLAAWVWEILFKNLFSLFTITKKHHYTDLLIGIENITLEANQALWVVANEKDPNKKKHLYETFLESYGSRVDDMEIAYKTLREKPKALEKLLELNQDTPSPLKEHEKMAEKYLQTRANVKTRTPKPLFNKFVDKVRSNVALREDRRFYEFALDYKIRSMLLELGNRLNIPDEELFNKSWKELKNAAN